MQRRVDLFGPDVADFNPSRWTTWTPPPWHYIPFNGGPRICLGQNFALTEMAYATARLCQAYERVEERIGGPRGSQRFRTDITITPVGGVKVALIPAFSSEK
jgi:cytochrome P450